MALVTLVSIGLIDEDGTRKRVPYFVDNSLTVAQITAFVAGIAPLLDDVTGCQITDATATLDIALPNGLDVAATAGTEAEKGALLNFDAANTSYSFSQFVPGWLPGGFTGNTVTDAGVYHDYIDAIVAGAGVDTTQPRNNHGDDLTAYNGGSKRFRK